MTNKLKNTVFYILIIDGLEQDQTKLRDVITRLIPQAFIESIYSETETISYFNNLKLAPNLIIVDNRMNSTALRLAIYMIRKNNDLKTVPLVLVNSDLGLQQRRELKYLGVSEFYMGLNNPLEMKVITNDIKNRWLIPRY